MPVTIETLVRANAMRWEMQRKVFRNPRGLKYYYALIYRVEAGTYYLDIYKSSDGSSWSLAGTVYSTTSDWLESCSIWHREDPTNQRTVVYVSYTDSTVVGSLYYRAGYIPDTGTSITWFAAVQTPVSGEDGVFKPSITYAADGYVWIIFERQYKSKGKTYYDASVVATTTTDPTGSPGWSSPYDLGVGAFDARADVRTFPTIIPCAAAETPDILAQFKCADETGDYVLFSCYAVWDGASFDKTSLMGVALNSYPDSLFSTAYDPDAMRVHVAFRHDSTKYRHSSIAYGYLMATPDDIYSGDVGSCSLSIDVTASPNKLYAFYIRQSGKVNYKTADVQPTAPYVSDWSPEQSISDNTEPLDWLSSSYKDWNADGKIQVTYTRQTTYALRFAEVPVPPPVQKFTENLSIIGVVPVRRYGGVRTISADLSAIRDVFSFVWTKAPIVRQFIETLIISVAFVRRYSGIRAFRENLSTTSDVFTKIAAYKRRLTQQTVIRDAFTRILSIPRVFRENLSSTGDRFTRIVSYVRAWKQDLSAITDKFSFTYTPFIPVYKFVQNLSVISIRFSRVHGIPRAFVEDLSVLRDVFVRRASYLRQLPQVTIIKDSFKRFVGFPRKFIENLSVLKAVFIRKASYWRRFVNSTLIMSVFTRIAALRRAIAEDLSVIKALFVRRLAYLRKLVQSVLVQDRFLRLVKYFRALPQQVVTRDVFQRFIGFPRAFREDLSAISVRLISVKAFLRKPRQDLSVIRDSFSFVYTPIIPVYRFVQDLSVIRVVPKRVASYSRRRVQEAVIRDVLKRIHGILRPFRQDLSTVSIRLVRRVSYSRKFVNTPLIMAVFKRFVGFPRRLIQNLSTIGVLLIRRVSYLRKLMEDLSQIREIFLRKVANLRRLIQTTTIMDFFRRRIAYSRRVRQDLSAIRDFFIRRIRYLRRLPQFTYIQDKFSYVLVPIIKVYHFVQTLVISTRFRRRLSYIRKLRQDLSVIRDVFSSIYVKLVRIYRLVQNLSVISDAFTSVVVTPALEVLRRKVTGMQAEIADLYEKVKKKAHFYLGR